MGLNIVINWDSSVNSAPAGFKTDVIDAVQYLESTFTNPIAITIDVGYGEVDGQSLSADALGESLANYYIGTYSYAQIRNALIAENAPGSSTLPTSPPLSGGTMISTAEAKALGLSTYSGVDGWVGFSSSASFSYGNGTTPSANQYYFIGTVEHEITEDMGRVSFLNEQPHYYSPMDLYRYSSPGVRDTSIGGNGSTAYFSTNSGTTNLGSWNNQTSNGDLGDWYPSGPGPGGDDSFNDYSEPGVINEVSPDDITLMEALGFSPPQFIATPTFDTDWTLAGVGDVNGAGLADLVWQDQPAGQTDAQLLDGINTTSAGAIANNPFDSSWSIATTGDFNGDGRIDLVYQQPSTNLTEIMFLDGPQNAGGGLIANNPFVSGWNIAVSGDFTGNGDSDLVWQNQQTGLTEIQLLNGITPVGGGAIPDNPFDADWKIVTFGDFNAAGRDDLVWQNRQTGLVELQFMNGINAVGGGAILHNPLGAGWNVVGAGDFLGNGFDDLVYQQQSDGLVEIQFLNGLTPIGGGAIAGSPFGAGWQVVGVGDVNGDGKADLLYRNTATGTTEVQFLNGTTPIGGGIITQG